MNTTIEFNIFELVLAQSFILTGKFIFGPNLPKKMFALQKKKIKFTIFQLAWYQISSQANNYDFLGQICPKKYLQPKTQQLNITIGLSMFELT